MLADDKARPPDDAIGRKPSELGERTQASASGPDA